VKQHIVFIVCILAISGAFAAVENGALQNQKELAITCLNDSELLILELQESNFQTQRISDLLEEGKAYFTIQALLENQSKPYNYTKTIEYCQEVSQIYALAFESKDSLFALEGFYQESLSEEMNTTRADNIIAQIKQEMSDERYENTEELITQAYDIITQIKSDHTTFNLILQSTQTGITSFVVKNYIYIL
jgi:hypothetical protein